MLHTIPSISRVSNNVLKMNNHFYSLFDTRSFKSTLNVEETFSSIASNFINIFDLNIVPFLDSVIEKNQVRKGSRLIFTTEEAIFMKVNNIDPTSIKSYMVGTHIRMFAVPNMEENETFNVIESLGYSNINSTNFKILSIFIHQSKLESASQEEIDDILFKIINVSAISYIDHILSRDHNVPLNSTYTYDFCWNSDSIILPERNIPSDAIFIFWYFECLFRIIITITNKTTIKSFDDYADKMMLPIMFDDDFQAEKDPDAENYPYSIYNKIWNFAKRKVLYNEVESSEDLIKICTEIYDLLEIDLDEDYYYQIMMHNKSIRGDQIDE